MTIVPLTERVLHRLGPPRALWILLWASLLAGSYAAARRMDSPVYPGLGFAAISVYVVLLALWATGLIARRMTAFQPDLERLLGREEMDRIRPFARVNRTLAALLFAVIVGSGWELLVHVARSPSILTALLTPLFVLGWIPANASLWMVGVILFDLDRLGRSQLRLVPFEEDLTLGLRPLGSLAALVFALLSGGIVPVLVVVAVDLRSFLFALGQYVVVTALFVLSVWRLHTRLQQAKVRYVAEARTRYAQTLRQVTTSWSQDEGNEQAAARLSSAEAIERRAAAIHEWPLGAGAFGRVAAIFTAVVTAILVRLILAAVGL